MRRTSLSSISICLSILVALLAGCSTPRPVDDRASPALAERSQTPAIIPPFSSAKPGNAPPDGWNAWILHPTKRKTDYKLVKDGDGVVLSAHANKSASGLIAPLNVNLEDAATLEWTWRTNARIDEADNAISSREDSPLRIVLAFDGNKDTLSIKERMFADRVKLFSGRDLPYATLMYIWGNQLDLEALIQNPHTSRIQKMVVDNHRSSLKTWRNHRRNIKADYRRAFGKDPGRLIGIAVMTDTDNTSSVVSAYYGDIRLLPGEATKVD